MNTITCHIHITLIFRFALHKNIKIPSSDSCMNPDKDLKVEVRKGKGAKIKLPFLMGC